MGERPHKDSGFAPYIMYMIEQVTGHQFEYDRPHKVLKIIADLPEIGLPPPDLGGAAVAKADAAIGGAVAGGVSPPPHAPPRSFSLRQSPPPIHKMFSAIFGMCRDILTR